MFLPVRTVAPSETPVSLVEAKVHLRVDHDDENGLISGLINAATDYLDGWTGILGRALVNQTWRQDFTCFQGRVRLPIAPVSNVTSVKYFDTLGAEQTLATSVYALLADGGGPYIERQPGQTWPALADKPAPVSITFVAGYGQAASNVPMPIRQAILLHIGHLYANREAIADAKVELPLAHGALIAPFRRRTL